MSINILILISIITAGSLAHAIRCEDLLRMRPAEVTNASVSETAQIDNLVQQFYLLQAGGFANATQREIALSQFQSDSKIMADRIPDFKNIFQSRVQQLRTELAQSRDHEKREKEKQKKVRDEQLREALDPVNQAVKMTFHEIAPGKFMMGEIGSQVETQITKPFAMMQTQVTQMMWARLKIAMGEKDLNKINPSEFKTGADSTIVHIDGIEVQMKPDHPVEQVSWNDVKEYIDGLNKLSSASDTKTQDLLKKLVPGHQTGDVYDLPTEAQWEFVMRDRGNANKKHFDRDDEADVPNHAWFLGNAGNETHAVATKQARMINGKPFYDLEGNVYEWTKDSWNGGSKLPGGKDPLGIVGHDRILRGGSWFHEARYLRSDARNYYQFGSRSLVAGLRLVRTRP